MTQIRPKGLGPELVPLTITVPSDLRVRMIRAGVRPSEIARKAFEQEVKRKEELQRLARARQLDPLIKPEEIRRPTRRTRRLLGE